MCGGEKNRQGMQACITPAVNSLVWYSHLIIKKNIESCSAPNTTRTLFEHTSAYTGENLTSLLQVVCATTNKQVVD